LAKRHGGNTLASVAAGGDAVPKILGWLAQSLNLAEEGASVTAAADLLDGFDPDRIPRQPVRL
jgi:hypothetical protein